VYGRALSCNGILNALLYTSQVYVYLTSYKVKEVIAVMMVFHVATERPSTCGVCSKALSCNGILNALLYTSLVYVCLTSYKGKEAIAVMMVSLWLPNGHPPVVCVVGP
jgi:hypothetical protein